MNAVAGPILSPSPDWSERVRQTLSRYEGGLLRQVAHRLLRLRSVKPVEELVERMAAVTENAAAIDRRLLEIEPAGRSLLALMAQAPLPSWRLGTLLELLSVLQESDGLAIIFELMETGLLYPELGERPSDARRKLRSFEDWLGDAASSDYRVFVHPQVAARALTTPIPLPPLDHTKVEAGAVRETDGLDFFLRLGVLWQQVHELPPRLTQQAAFFKRDQERLSSDPVFTGVPIDSLVSLPDRGHLMLGLGISLGLLRREDAQINASTEFPLSWRQGFDEAIRNLWAGMLETQAWNAADGWRGFQESNTPYLTAGLLALALLAGLPEGQWASPADIGHWLATHHCYWREPPNADLTPWAEGFLLGIAYQLKLVQATEVEAGGRWLVRLSPTGRGVLGLGPMPTPPPYPKTLLVQPNLEIIAYRQGLTPTLIADLSRFCAWKQLGAACTLQLASETVYRGLQSGLTLDGIMQTLRQRGVREIPETVLQSLRTWAGKRERLAVYPAAAVLEFASPQDLQEAVSRGLEGVRISDLLLVVAAESAIDFRQFRLTATRDYTLPAEQCVAVEADGVTLDVDLARADLMLETELQRFAEPIPPANNWANNWATDWASNSRRAYRLTPASIARARDSGLTVLDLGEWFRRRTGVAISPAVQMIAQVLAQAHGSEAAQALPPLPLRRLLVLQAPSKELADGLMQWPQTRQWIQQRLGEHSLVVDEANVTRLQAELAELGLRLRVDSNAPPQSIAQSAP